VKAGRVRHAVLAAAAKALLVLAGAAAADEPVVIAHRGASGHLPEHTLPAYRLAIEQGADFIEPDLVMTKDGVLVARHERTLSDTTDVASRPEFAARAVVKPGRDTPDWYVEDFTLAELRTLRGVQRFPDRGTAHDGRYGVPTLAEILDLVEATGGRVGLYPEIKSPGAFIARGLDPGEALLTALDGRALGPVLIQSFDADFLKGLRPRTALPLVQLVYPASPETPDVANLPLDEIARYADGVGAHKALPLAGDRFMREARALGLFVHVWTLRDDRLPEGVPSAAAEIRALVEAGVDGLFTDYPDTAVHVLAGLRARTTVR
jgi:glycerophosphoryl diester phosphodiesterase